MSEPKYGCNRCQWVWPQRLGVLCGYCGGSYTHTILDNPTEDVRSSDLLRPYMGGIARFGRAKRRRL